MIIYFYKLLGTVHNTCNYGKLFANIINSVIEINNIFLASPLPQSLLSQFP